MDDWAAASKEVIGNSFLVGSIQFAVGLVICYLVQVVRFFRRKETAVGVLCTLCLILGGGGLVLGIPVAILFGWLKARQWSTGTFMWVFTGLFVVILLNLAAAFLVK